MATRTTEEWVLALTGQGQPQAEALTDLRELLLRAALFTLVSHLDDLNQMNEQERTALAEDCAQEALQAVLTRLPDFRGESKFTTWAYKFGINTALTRARQQRWKNISLDALSDEEEDAFDRIQWAEGVKTADSEMPALQSEISTALREIIRADLTSRQRQVLRWIAFDEVPMDVVVERLDLNRNAVYKMLHDARLKIKRQMAARGYNLEEVYDFFRAT